MNLKVGDKVVVIAGSDKGKEGKIIKTLRNENRVVVEGVHMIKKHVKPNGQESGGILEIEAPIHASNVMIVDSKTKKRTRIGYTTDKNGEYTVKGKSIGVTETTTAFYNSDKNTWATGATIDPNDQSGMNFLEKMESLSVTLDDYIDKARNDHPYDFKVTNGTNGVVSRDIKYQYRGMSIGKNETDQNIYTSARDVGNIAAGIVAAKNGISWLDARLAFDVYQSYSSRNLEMEGLSTQSAQLYGWLITSIKTPPLLKTVNRGASLISTFKKIFNTLF